MSTTEETIEDVPTNEEKLFLQESPQEISYRESTDESLREEGEKRSPEAVFDEWFGTEDTFRIAYHADLGPARVPGYAEELYVDGVPLSELLDPDDLPYYTEIFLPHTLEDGIATWRGESHEDGGVLEGCIATRKGSRIEMVYGTRAVPTHEQDREEHIGDDHHAIAIETNTRHPIEEERLTLDLDDALEKTFVHKRLHNTEEG